VAHAHIRARPWKRATFEDEDDDDDEQIFGEIEILELASDDFSRPVRQNLAVACTLFVTCSSPP
jgi:hypothetical protein